jgi:uncharacterized protein (DUF2249 family)
MRRKCPGSLTHLKARARAPVENVGVPPRMSLPVFKRLDARKLLARGIEPFPEIRKCVDALKTGEGLAVIAPFLPSPLIEKLRGENFHSRVEPQPDGSWITYFWREAADG